jgi:RNA recognition motif-containing protein
MAKNLFVGNLSFSTTESSLSEMFSQVGIVDSVKIITDMHSGRSRGFGFVEMSTDKEAEKAIAEFNGKEFQGRQLVVNEARPQESRGGRRSNY